MNRTVFGAAAAGRDDDNPEGGARGGLEDAPPMEPSAVYTCVVETGPKICFATYDEESNNILLEECACDSTNFTDVVESYYSLVRPNLLLVGSNIVSNVGFLETLTSPVHIPDEVTTCEDDRNGMNDDDDTCNGNGSKARSIKYRILKTTQFDSRNCMALIMQKLRVLALIQRSQNSENQRATFRQFRTSNTTNIGLPISNYHSLGALIDFDSQLQVKALGALLSFLHSTVFRLEPGGTITVANIVHTRSSMYMNINASTLAALHIFSTEHHPLMAVKGRGNSKEGSSLFSLLDKTKSRGGRQMLRSWMLKPLLNREEIHLRQDGIELFLGETFDIESSLGVILCLLQEVGPINQIIKRFKKCASLPIDFVTLSRTLSAASEICRVLEDLVARLRGYTSTDNSHLLQDDTAPLPGHVQGSGPVDAQEITANSGESNRLAWRYTVVIERILERCNMQTLIDMNTFIDNAVDDESTLDARDTVCIQKGYSEELDQLKERYAGLNEHLYEVCEQIMNRHPELGNLVVVFIPQVGFLTGIQTELVGMQKDRVFDSRTGQQHFLGPIGFEFIFDNDDDGLSYFKNNEMRMLDESNGDLDGLIKDMESVIVTEIEDFILENEIDLRETFLALSELDCIISFALVAKERGYVRPVILDPPQENLDGGVMVINIRNGRHALQEILVEGDFIPNETDFSCDAKRVNVVTGANFSGKSCYARQVGILVYMAQIGSFIPCESARISIFDQIWAQFSSVETCAVPQSSFQLDLTQLGTILRRSTPRSLVLVDEFGKGTSPVSGIALLSAAIRKFARAKVTCVITTHFLEMFSRQLIVDGENGIKALRMAVHVPEDREDIAVPLFRLEEGVADSSAGIVCAKMAGLTRSVVTRAKEIVGTLKEGNQLTPNAEVQRAIASRAIPPAAQTALRVFLSQSSWADASDEEVKAAFRAISKIP